LVLNFKIPFIVLGHFIFNY